MLCLVRDGRLVQVVRRVQTQPSAQLQAEHLVAAPDESERAAGLTTALAGLSLTVQVTTGPAQVEIIGTDESSSRNDETIGYAQIVCTLTTRPDVRSVVFTRSGDRLDVPRADGSLSREPLYSSDYASLVGPA